jgi:hypothetical protein
LEAATEHRSGFCALCHSEQECIYPANTDCRSDIVDFACYKAYRNGKVVAMVSSWQRFGNYGLLLGLCPGVDG